MHQLITLLIRNSIMLQVTLALSKYITCSKANIVTLINLKQTKTLFIIQVNAEWQLTNYWLYLMHFEKIKHWNWKSQNFVGTFFSFLLWSHAKGLQQGCPTFWLSVQNFWWQILNGQHLINKICGVSYRFGSEPGLFV